MRLKEGAVVTGGALGISEAEARLFAEEGATVVVAVRLSYPGEALCEAVAARSHRRSGTHACL
jgi:NAD(P)-dependent dehydrogenase (short-subunit alcohol dehydrogenase family)